jgi:PPP family 3-phenylpropionic acid transporter
VAARGTAVVPPALALALAATALLVHALPPSPAGARAQALGARDFARALKHPPLARFLAVVFLQQAGFGGYYGFYTLYLAAHGYGAAAAGLYWAVAVVAEVVLFAAGGRLVGRFPLEALLRVALAGTVVRWLVVAALPDSRPAMLAAQVLHLAGFGLFHLVTVQLAPRLVPPGGAARAQALVASIGWGAGGIAGTLIAGAVWQALGPGAVFLVAASLALAALLLAIVPVQAARTTSDPRD